MRARLLSLIAVAFVVLSLGVNAKPATALAATINISGITCHSVNISGVYAPSTPFLAAVSTYPFAGLLGPIVTVTTDAAGNYSATLSFTASVGQQVIAITTFSGGTGAIFTVPPCAFESFNPGDARVDPRAGDRVAVYCNLGGDNANTIGVYGILDDGTGKYLTTFRVGDIVKAGGNGITRSVEPLGAVYISVSGSNSFYVKWMGGPADATGQGDFRKRFTCNFS